MIERDNVLREFAVGVSYRDGTQDVETDTNAMADAILSLRAERDALRKDAARLNWMAENPPFDGFSSAEMDVYEHAGEVANAHGREEATANDYHEGFRRMIDAAMAVQPTTECM